VWLLGHVLVNLQGGSKGRSWKQLKVEHSLFDVLGIRLCSVLSVRFCETGIKMDPILLSNFSRRCKELNDKPLYNEGEA
jgi:hypothetical protein